MDGFGAALEAMIKGMIITSIIVTTVVVGGLTFTLTRWFTPTPDSIAKDKRRQEVVNQLTPEQREVLGIK